MKELQLFVKQERMLRDIFPAPSEVFKALHLTPFDRITTVIIGQDPYHTPGVADGLAFSSAKPGYCPPSLENILKEVIANLKMFNTKFEYDPLQVIKNFSLERWASEEGVLLLNPILTVEKGKPLSHREMGWETFTKRILTEIATNHKEPVVVMLWGKEAQKYYEVFDWGEGTHHLILKAPHPAADIYNPKAGFSGSNHFYQERIFRLRLQAKNKSKQWPVTWLNLANKSL